MNINENYKESNPICDSIPVSKHDGMRNEHIVSIAHIKRFLNDDGQINVYRFSGNSYSKYELDELCSALNYYDSGDPYSKKSAESFITDLENELQPYVDKVINGTNSPTDDVKIFKYVKHLLERSRDTRLSAKDMPDELKLSNEKDTHFRHIVTGSWLNEIISDDYCCSIVDAKNGEEFITSDQPVICLDTRNVLWII